MQIPGSYNTNLAYDLSRFDVQEQEKHNARRREEQEKAKREIRMNSRSVSRSGSRVKVILAAGVAFAALCIVGIVAARVVFPNSKAKEEPVQVEESKNDEEDV